MRMGDREPVDEKGKGIGITKLISAGKVAENQRMSI